MLSSLLYVKGLFLCSHTAILSFICPFHRSLSATTLSFAATDSSTELRFLTSKDTPLSLFTRSRLPLTSRRYDPAGLGGRGGPVLRLVEGTQESVKMLRVMHLMGLMLSAGPSFLMADPMGPLLDQDDDEALSPFSSLEGRSSASPPLSLTSYASSLSPFQTLSPSPSFCASPPPSPTDSSILGSKTGTDSLSHTWLGTSDLLDARVGADDGKGEVTI